MEYHEAADIFPLAKEDIPALAKDIKASGLIVPIQLLDGKILDGRRRFSACKEAGVEPKFTNMDDDVDDPVQYVLSLNMHRRHLTPSQKAMAAAKASALLTRYREEAKERMTKGVGEDGSGGRGKKTLGPRGPRVSSTDEEETEPEKPEKPPTPRRSRDAIGKAFDVSGRSVDRAVNVEANAAPEVIEAVERGEVSINAADKFVRRVPKEQQPEALKEVINPPKVSTNKSNQSEKFYETDAEGKVVVDKYRERAVRAQHDTIDLLMRSPLVKISKDNPHREYAYKQVVRWLNHNLKRT